MPSDGRFAAALVDAADRPVRVHTTLGGMIDASSTTQGGVAQPSWAGMAAATANAAAPAVPTTAPRAAPAAAGPTPPSSVAARIGDTATAVPVRGRVSSTFGDRTHPITGAHRHHAGVDVAAPTGTPVRAATVGRVSHAGSMGGYGLVVEIDHGSGVTSRYAHLSALDVAVGDRVAAGARVGAVGSTGNSTGPHLHLELRVDGTSTDPAWLLG